MPQPDFGWKEEMFGTVPMRCRYAAPGLTLHDLTMIFEEAKKGGNEVAGDPSEWPDVRGVKAVTEAVLAAVYKD